MPEGVLDEIRRVQIFPLQATLHVGERDDHGVYLTGCDRMSDLIGGEHAFVAGVRHQNSCWVGLGRGLVSAGILRRR